MLNKPILPFLFAASVLAIQGCDNDSSSSSRVISDPNQVATSTFTVCVDNSNATASCDPSQAPQVASIQFERAIKNALFSPAYAAAVTGQTQFFLFYVDSNGTIDPNLTPVQASASTTGLNDGFYQITVTGDPTDNIANDRFPVLLTDFNSSLSLTDIANSATLAGINAAQNSLGFNTAFTLLSDIDDSDGDGISLDRISSDLSLIIISENLLGTQTVTTLNTFLDDTTSQSITARGTNPDADLTTLVQNNQPEPDPTLQVFEDMTINGTVSGSAGAQAAASSSEQGVALDEVGIIVLGLDQAGAEVFRLVTETDENGLFNISIPTVQNSADSVLTRIEVTMQKDGYVVGEKVFTEGFETGTSLSLRALLGQETVVTQSRDQLAITASGDRRFRLGLIRYENGEVAAVAGEQFADARASADSDTLLDMEIPEDCVPVETTAVTARVAYFDPNDQTDVQSFPGTFEGTGDDSAGGSGINLDGTSNDENYRLVSSVFSQVKLENQDGDNLSIDSNCGSTSGASAAAEGDAAVMTLNVPTESYDTITEDVDANTEGNQVPIYIYSNGWKFAGNGTLVVLSETAGVDYDLYDGTIPPDVNVTPDLFVQITVTEGNEWIQWVNLDWPIRPETNAQTLCLSGTIKFDGQNADELEPYNGTLEIESNTGWEWAYIDQGVVDFSTLLSDGAQPDTFNYQVWNWRSNAFEQLTPTEVDPPQDENCDVELTFDSTLENPLQCAINGTITKSNGEAAPFFWFELNASDQFFNWGNSDEQGNYSVGAPCDLDATIYVAGQDFAVESDNYENGVQTVNIQLENAAPEVWAWAPWRMVNGETVLVDVFAFDADGTVTELTATTCEGGTCTDTDTTTGGPFSYQADTVGEHTITFTATDNEEATGTTSLTIIVDPAGNKPPRINSFLIDGAFGGVLDGIIVGRDEFIQVRSGDDVTITVEAFDPDADPLTYAWTGCDTASTTNQCVVTTSNPGETVISVTVTDQPTQGEAQSTTSTLTLLVQADEAPFVGGIFSIPAVAIDDGDGNTEAITFKAFVDDDFTAPEELTFNWTLTASDGSGTTMTGTDPELVVGQGELDAGMYAITVEVSDANNTTTQDTVYEVKEHQAPVIIVPDTKNVLTNENNNNAEDIFIFAEVTDDLTLEDQLDISWAVTGTEITATGNSLEILADTLPKGTYNAVVTVRDGPEGNEATKTATATVVINVISVPSDTDVIVQ